MAGATSSFRPSAGPSVRLAALGCLALAAGTLVYLTDRDPSRAALIPAIPALAGLGLFGGPGAWLPSFVHPFAFSLFTAAIQPARRSPAYWACALWWAINVAFEIAQAPTSARAWPTCCRMFSARPGWRTRFRITCCEAPSRSPTSSPRQRGRPPPRPCSASSTSGRPAMRAEPIGCSIRRVLAHGRSPRSACWPSSAAAAGRLVSPTSTTGAAAARFRLLPTCRCSRSGRRSRRARSCNSRRR